ncbi:MAG: hypothetical protein ACYTG0_33030 [Planctomycetota bacterium]|jgi:hypothetical protein
MSDGYKPPLRSRVENAITDLPFTIKWNEGPSGTLECGYWQAVYYLEEAGYSDSEAQEAINHCADRGWLDVAGTGERANVYVTQAQLDQLEGRQYEPPDIRTTHEPENVSTPVELEDTPECKETRKPIQLAFYAIGVETGSEWWIFRKYRHQWRQHGKVDIPSGNPTKIAEMLADCDGMIERAEAIKLFKGDYHGMGNREIRKKVVTPALAKLRIAIRESIARVAHCERANVGDPIPWDKHGGSWRAAIEIGFAHKDDEGRTVFRLKQDF